MNAKLELVQSWLTKGRNDLAAARRLADGPEPYLDVAVYHCQQAAEKAVKGLLVFYDQPFPKTHDIEVLVTLAAQYDTRLTFWAETAVELTPYATEFRYPGGILAPPPDEFEAAFEGATEFYAFILSLLPAEAQP